MLSARVLSPFYCEKRLKFWTRLFFLGIRRRRASRQLMNWQNAEAKKTRTNCVLQFPMEIVAFYYLFIYIVTATLSQQRLLWRSHRDSVFVQRCQQQYTQSASLQLGPFPTSVASIHATRQRRLLQNQRRTRLRSRSSNWRQHGTHRFLPAGTWRWRRRITLRRFASCPLVAFISFSTHNGTHLTRWDKQEYQTFLSHLIIIIIIFIDNCR